MLTKIAVRAAILPQDGASDAIAQG